MKNKVPPNHDQIWTESNIQPVFLTVMEQLHKYSSVRLALVDEIGCQEINSDHKYTVSDNYIKNESYIALWPEFYGNYLYNAEFQDRAPDRLFNCFMNRACSFRQSWLYQFQRQGLIDDGYITYNLDYRSKDFYHLKGTVDLFDALYHNGNNQIFEKEHHILHDKVPFFNLTNGLEQTIIDSKVSIVIETYFSNENAVAFSEKIFRVLQLPRPFLLFCASGAVDFLRRLGFDVYDDLIDHRYDQAPDPIHRQMAILKQLNRIKKLDYTDELQQDFYQRARHNQQILLQLKTAWPDKYKSVLEQIK